MTLRMSDILAHLWSAVASATAFKAAATAAALQSGFAAALY